VEVKVECPGEAHDSRLTGLGIGLDVTRRRLACLYGEDRFALDVLVRSGFSSVRLRLPHDRTPAHTDRG
jgi:LytS/YehU family sensor histidine kinase